MKTIGIALVGCLLALASCSMSLSSQVVSPLTAGSTNTSYSYAFAATAITVPAGSQLVAQFDTGAFAISQVNGCQLSMNGVSVSGATCVVNTSSNAVIWSGVAASSLSLSNLSVSFYSNGASYSGTSNILFYFQDSTGLQNTDSRVNTTVSIVAATMTGCSVTTANQTVGASSTYNLAYTPAVQVATGSILQIVLPAWFGNSTNLLNNASANCSSNCSALLISTSETVTFKTIYSSAGVAAAAPQTAAIFSIKNPPSTAPISIQFIVQTSNNQNVQQCFYQLSVNTPNSLRAAFAPSNLTISAGNSIKLSFRSSNPIPGSTSYLRISSPLGLAYSYAAANSTSTTAPVRVSSTDGSVLISGLSTSNIAALSLYNLGLFTLTNGPSSKKYTLTFTTQTYSNNSFYSIDSSSVDIQAVPSTITVANVSAQNSLAYAIGQFSVSFTSANALVQGSFAVLQFPTEMSIATASTCSTNVGSCFFSGNTVTINVQSAVAGGSNITTVLSLVQNPLTTTPSSTFSISTYYDTSDSLVDQLTSGLTFTALPVPLKVLQVLPQSSTVRDVTNYTFNVNFTNPVPTGTILYLTFPSSLPISSVMYTSNNTLGCVVSTNLQTVTLTGCFSADYTGMVTFTLGGITNPTSKKPTTTFNLTSTYNGLLLEYLSSAVTVAMTTPMAFGALTLSATNLTVNAQTTYTFSVQSLFTHSTSDVFLVGIPTEVTLTAPQCTVVTGISSLSCSLSGTTLIVTLTGSSISPTINFMVSGFLNNWYTSTSSFTIQSATSDANQYLIESGSTSLSFVAGTMSCSTASDNQIVLLSQSTIKLTVTAPFTLSKATNTSGLRVEIAAPTTSFTVSSTGCNTNGTCTYNSSVNGYEVTSLTTNSFPLLVTFSAQTGYFTTSDSFTIKLLYQGQLVSTNLNTTVAAYCTLPCQQCTLSRTTCSSCLPSNYTLNTTIFRGNSTCVQTCPDGFYANTTTVACELCNANCSKCSGSATNCSACQPTSGTYLYNNTCTNSCPSNYYQNTTTVMCMQCPVGCSTCTNSTYCLTCQALYLYSAGVCVSNCPNSSYVPVNGVCTACTNNCYTCSGATSNCTSCNTGFIFYNSTCVTQCPSRTYLNGSSCYSCQSPCLECSSSLVCTSCNSSMSLFDNRTCVTSCPSGYISIAQVCTACTSGCATCAVLTSNCTSCTSSLYLYNGNTCVTNCPAPTQPNGNVCSVCVSPCVTCTGTASNCTSCNGTMYLLNNNCFACQSPCVSCTSSTVCTSCNSTMSLFDSRTCVTTCPSGYISIAQVCTACSSECATCSGVTNNCTSCPGNLYFYNNNTCVANCPAPTHPYGKICTLCISPCATCTGTATNCTSCQSNMVLLNGSCYSQCPTGYYANNQQCYSCGNCMVCTTATNCTTCYANNYLLDGLCYSSCPPSAPILVGQTCVSCSSECFTCEVIPINCTSCSTTTFLLRYTCVASCPLGMYTDRSTNKCLDSLSSRIVFFPLLIICVVLAALVFVSKCFARNTAIPTALVACFALPEVCSYAYYTVELSQDQEGINVLVTMILAIAGIVLLLAVSITFYVLNRKRIMEDPFFSEWMQPQCNYYTYLICMHVSLLNFKFYRIVYCRLFNSQALSLYLKFPKSVFPLTTIFTVVVLFLSEVLVGVSAALTLYNKNNKDQVFYTALECLLVTAITAVMSLVDIYKADDFFTESELLMAKKYADRTKDERKEEVDEVSIFDVPSMAVDSQNCFGTGQKMFYSKQQDSSGLLFAESNNKIDDQIDEEELSHNLEVETQVDNRKGDLSQYGSSRKKRVNIFQPIRQEQAEEDFEAQTMERFYRTQNHREPNFQQIVKSNLRRQKSDVGQSPPRPFDIPKDDIMSLAEPKQLRKRWNDIIEARREEARRLFRSHNKNTIDMGTTDKYEGYRPDIEIPKGRRRKLKVTKSMKRTQEIYLQRLVVLEDKDRPAPTSLKKKRRRKNRKESEEYCFPEH